MACFQVMYSPEGRGGRYGFIDFWACWSGLEDYKVSFSQVNKFSSIKGKFQVSCMVV